MSPVTIYSPESPTAKLIVLICLFWPFLAASFLSRRTTSAGPTAAVLVPLALSVAGMWMGLGGALWVLTIPDYTPSVAAVSAGIAEALAFPWFGAMFAVIVIIVTAIRRHRPVVDRLIAVLFALLVVDVSLALPVGRAGLTIAAGRWQSYECLSGAIVAGVIAFIAGVWTFLTGRGRVSSRPLPYGIPVVAMVCVVMGVVLLRALGYYSGIARFG